MTNPEWLKPGLYGIAIGAILASTAGFTWGGWVTGSTANDMALAMSRDNVAAAMVPICLENADNDPQRAQKIETIREASTYQRRDALMKTGWATVPGSDAPSRDVARACLASLEVDGIADGSETAAIQE